MPSKKGHFVALEVSMQTDPALAESVNPQFDLAGYAWKAIAANGTTFNGDLMSFESMMCLPEAETSPPHSALGRRQPAKSSWTFPRLQASWSTSRASCPPAGNGSIPLNKAKREALGELGAPGPLLFSEPPRPSYGFTGPSSEPAFISLASSAHEQLLPPAVAAGTWETAR